MPSKDVTISGHLRLFDIEENVISEDGSEACGCSVLAPFALHFIDQIQNVEEEKIILDGQPRRQRVRPEDQF